MGRCRGWMLAMAVSACGPDAGDQDASDDGSDGSDGSSATHECDPTSSGPAVDPGLDLLGACADIPTPVCGDGVLHALEECEGQAQCNACTSTRTQTPFVCASPLGPIAFAGDGSAVGIVGSFDDTVLRGWDAQGHELWSTAMPAGGLVEDVAVDEDGHVYAVGIRPDEALAPFGVSWMASFAGDGSQQWTFEIATFGRFFAVAAATDRVAVVGHDSGEGLGNAGRLHLLDTAGNELWSVVDDSLIVMDSVAFVGTELAVVAFRSSTGNELQRYGDAGELRWQVPLPPLDAAGGACIVVSDGVDGTWSAGEREMVPYAVHHDADGNIIEELDCIGGAKGAVRGAAMGDDGRLALAIVVHEGTTGDQYEYHAWFPVIDNGAVAWATSFVEPQTFSGAPHSVAWRADGALVVAWTDHSVQPLIGSSDVRVIPP